MLDQTTDLRAMLNDPELLRLAQGAEAVVLEGMGVAKLSNAFYQVHPRRNDRFIESSALLRTIYREVDFAEFNFANHMLQRLRLVSPDRFHAVLDELRTAWLARMRLVLSQIPGKTILLWASDTAPSDVALDLEADPAFVTHGMIAEIEPLVTECVQVVASDTARAAGTDGMVFAEMDGAAAAQMLGPMAHREIADALVPVLRELT